jgi:prepilin peptidase dependent protein B
MLTKYRQDLNNRTPGYPNHRQSGATLLESLIALALSAIVTIAMVVLMGNSMGASTRIIGMTQMSDEMRNVMSMLTRDVRRANYSANSIYCFGHSNCGNTVAQQSSDIVIDAGLECITFQLDRSYINSAGSWQLVNGNATDDPKGGFRRRTVSIEGTNRGVIEMWVGTESGAMPDCGTVSAEWLAVTNPNAVDIIEFTIDDGLSLERTLSQEGGSSFTQRQRQLHIAIEGELVIDQKFQSTGVDVPMVRRRVEDSITVRNDFIAYTPAP